MLEYFEPFNWVQTIVMLVFKQISTDLFKEKITNKLLFANGPGDQGSISVRVIPKT